MISFRSAPTPERGTVDTLPKKASLISVLSVRRIIFTTQITARGVRKEMAWKKQQTIPYEDGGWPSGADC